MVKKILVVNAHDLDTGAGRSCVATLELLANHGYQIVHVACSKGKVESYLQELGIPTIYCDFPSWYPQVDSKGRKMNILHRIKYMIRSLIINHISIRIICRQLKERNFVPDLVYTNTMLWYMGLFLAKKYNCPHYFHVREYGFEDFRMYFVLGRKLSSMLANRYTQKAFCISKGVLDAWKDFFGDKAILMYNGIKNPNISYCKHRYIQMPFRVMIVGRLSEEKGQYGVIEQLPQILSKSFQTVVLDLYGAGVQEHELRQLVSDLSLNDHVNFCGFSENIDYSKYHLAIMPSRSEGFGRTTIEYMFNSVPVVGYRGGATPEFIEDGVSGRLYNNSEELIDIVCDAIKNYSKYSVFAKRAYDTAISKFSLEVYTKNILQEF